MRAIFYSFNKRINSTKRPQDSDITISGDVALKNPTSLRTPIIIMAVGQVDKEKAFASNYLLLGEKFYWITDVIAASRDHIEYHCKIDVLATYKVDIVNTKAYVERASVHGDFNLADPLILATAGQKYSSSHASMSDLLMPTNASGWTIVNLCSYNDVITTYLMDSTVAPKFMAKICDPSFMEQLGQYISNPFDYIVSAYQCPFKPGAFSMSSDAIIIGNYLIDDIAGAQKVMNNITEKNYTLKVPRNYSDFRAISPISRATLFLPFVGTVDIDTARLRDSDSIEIQVFADIRTGDIIYQLYYTAPHETEVVVRAQAYSGNCYSQIPLARTSNDIKALSQSIVGTATTLLIGATSLGKSAKAMEAAIPMMTATAGMTITSGIGALEAQTSMKGELSTFLGKCLGDAINLSVWSNETSCNPSDLTETIGNPVNKTYMMSELIGYVQTQNFSLAVNSTVENIDEVNALMDGGVYIE